MIDIHKPIIGFLLAAPLSGKDTLETALLHARPHVAIIHMSTLLQIVIQKNEEYKRIVQEGGLLPPEEAVKAFRRGFLEITQKCTPSELPNILANGPCREELETKSNISMIERTRPDCYQKIGFRLLLDQEHIRARADYRIQQAYILGKKPRPDDLGNTPVIRYQTFHQNLGPVLCVFEKKGGILIDIDANKTPEQVLSQVVSVYDQVIRKIPAH